MNGTVKFFNNSKGFGFINGEDGKDYFVHTSGLESEIADADSVEFEIMTDEKGPKAINVRKV